jgi:hypothetical protein
MGSILAPDYISSWPVERGATDLEHGDDQPAAATSLDTWLPHLVPKAGVNPPRNEAYALDENHASGWLLGSLLLSARRSGRGGPLESLS